jgi:hypothetical protein
MLVRRVRAIRWSSYDRIWFSGPDKHEIFTFKGDRFFSVTKVISKQA